MNVEPKTRPSSPPRFFPLRFLLIASAVGLIGYACILATVMWDFRETTYTLQSATGSLSDDRRVLTLSEKALRLHGLDPANFTVAAPQVYRNTINTNRVQTYWRSRQPQSLSWGVTLEQSGATVSCSIGRLK